MLQALEQIIADLSGESEPALPSSLGLLAPLCDRLLRGPEPRESLLRLRALLLALGEEEADWPGESLPTHSGPSRRAEAPRSQGASQVPVLIDTGLAAEHSERGWIGDAGDAE